MLLEYRTLLRSRMCRQGTSFRLGQALLDPVKSRYAGAAMRLFDWVEAGARHILKSKLTGSDLFSPQIGSLVPCHQETVI